MSEDLLEFENAVQDPEGRGWIARVRGARREDGHWIGWIRFVSAEGESVETDRETTQPDRHDLRYWAGGLTYAYLEGALNRARARAAGARPARRPGGGAAPVRRSSPRTPRIEVATPDPSVVSTVMGAVDPPPGTARKVANSGVIVYEGTREEDDEERHVFAVHFGSRTERATLANWLWSRLHGTGSVVRVGGRPIDLTNAALDRALAGNGS